MIKLQWLIENILILKVREFDKMGNVPVYEAWSF